MESVSRRKLPARRAKVGSGICFSSRAVSYHVPLYSEVSGEVDGPVLFCSCSAEQGQCGTSRDVGFSPALSRPLILFIAHSP